MGAAPQFRRWIVDSAHDVHRDENLRSGLAKAILLEASAVIEAQQSRPSRHDLQRGSDSLWITCASPAKYAGEQPIKTPKVKDALGR